jgi:membrane protease subunit HflC
MSGFKSILIIVVAIFTLIFIFSSTYIVTEADQVIITQFGSPQGDAITEPGLYFKIPIIQKVNRFDKRFLEWDGAPGEFPNKDKTFIFVDTYARWKIVDPLLFFEKLRDEKGAQSRLDDILDGGVREAVANNSLIELVRSENREFRYNEEIGDTNEEQLKIKIGRTKIITDIIKEANDKTKELGIAILDLRIKQIKYRDDVLKTVYDRMNSERMKIANRFLSEGQGLAQEILGKKENDLRAIRSEAVKNAEKLKGNADAEATRIYASAYDKNADTRDFYRFLKTMETYKNTLNANDVLILSTKGEFFKYLQSSRGQ